MRNLNLNLMRRCLELASQAKGLTSPNPMVGCVIVKDDQIIGEGFHPGAGQPHAEVFAIAAAKQKYGGSATQGATLYVNLEPCNHYGRTPPCTEAIMAAGITRTIVGTIDPDPRVSGQGCDRLRAAGIEVITGILERECQELNEAFIYRVKHNLPFGTLKYAMTLDGKIATATGHSFWVTGEVARHEVHLLRASCDAIVTGGGTVRQDNPLLTTHNLTAHSPLRLVMTRHLNLPRDAQLWAVSARFKTIVATQRHQNPLMQDYLRDRGVEVIEFDDLSPHLVMLELGRRGCNSVLWECGGVLAASAIADRVIQKVWAFIAPKIVGGNAAPGPIGELGCQQMTAALPLHRTDIRAVGNDWLITGYLEDEESSLATSVG